MFLLLLLHFLVVGGEIESASRVICSYLCSCFYLGCDRGWAPLLELWLERAMDFSRRTAHWAIVFCALSYRQGRDEG